MVRNWVVTLLGREDVGGAENDAHRIMKEQGLEFDHGFTPERIPDASYTHVRLHGYGSGVDAEAMRVELARVAEDRQVDVVLQPESELKRERRLFVFDMDSTLIQGETIDELARLAGVGEKVAAITTSAMRGEIDFQESFRRRVRLLKGLRETEIVKVIDRLPLMDGAERLFRELKVRGKKTAVFSGGFVFLGRLVQERLGIDYLEANVLDVADGVVTGEVRGAIVDGARKRALLEEVSGREGIALDDAVAVGDGANDLPMLRIAGVGVAFHAKPVVRAEARVAMTHVGLDGLLEIVN
ncbi:phosphoserine phosphatase SerB [Acidicapsa dinghuensis]|uniref:Phosphoserine phosphatase n=1 Tax=Acidicapsa dinghuensis TaxID=2218256 RepID=A0ABW1EK02_9BACT|nr:phosphoserine phosphatase SerB [Acidicapsa dinghuensis]